MSQLTVDQALQLALEHQQSGQLAEAEDIFRQILEAYPDQADALHMLGGLYLQAKRPDLAEASVRHALLIRNESAFQLTLGLILQSTHQFEEAAAVYRALIAQNPDLLDAYLHLGVVLSHQSRFEDSAAAFQQALNRPAGAKNPVAQGNLGIVLCHLRRWDEALWLLREAIALRPDDADFHAALGATLYFKQQPDAALAACRKAIALNPNQGPALNILANILRDTGHPAESTQAAKQAAEILPDLSDVQINYGESLRSAGRLDEAADQYRRALLRIPNSVNLHNNLANCLKDTGLLDEAIVEYRKAISPAPPALPHASHFSNLLYTLHYHPDYTHEKLAEELRHYDAAFAQPLRPLLHPNDRDPNRRLRIGYISSEFRQHALGLNLLPLLSQHDKSQFEISCYADVANPDFYTFRLRQCADHWHDIRGISDADLADLIRRHQIDILLDLHQHIAGNRLPLFTRKPAPVQIAFAGYPGSSGLTAMDFRLTDPYLEPPDQPQLPSTETAIRLANTWWCYHPATEVPINDLPALTNSRFTFGNLNNFCKLNDGVYHLWARIMTAIPESQLLLLAPEGAHRLRTKAFFESQGIRGDRIRFAGRRPAADYYKLYHQIDLTLDSFPCNGHTTSMDSFFMGVPVTTIIGDRLFGRATWSQLNNLQAGPHGPEDEDLRQLAGRTLDEFVQLSIVLARDLPHLTRLRQSLRPRMKASPLMDDAGFARAIEAAYRQAWQHWVHTPPRI